MQWRTSPAGNEHCLVTQALPFEPKAIKLDTQKPGRASWGVMAERGTVCDSRCPLRRRASAAQRVHVSSECKARLRQERLRC